VVLKTICEGRSEGEGSMRDEEGEEVSAGNLLPGTRKRRDEVSFSCKERIAR